MFDTAVGMLPGLGPVAPQPALDGAGADDAPFDAREGLAGLDPVELGRRVEGTLIGLYRAEARQWALAAAWADAHPVPAPGGRPGGEQPVQVGGDGTPLVAEFCCAEFGTLNRVGYLTGRAMLAAALDLRHRLPRLWQQLCAGRVRGYKARQVAEATRHLDAVAAGQVDAAVAGLVEVLAWPRFQTILGAAILTADPAAAQDRVDRARRERKVWCTDSADGLKTVVARLDAGDATWFLAVVNRIAQILKMEGSTEPVGARRAAAVGILGQPATALALLARHADDPDTGPDDENEANADGDPGQAPPAGPDPVDTLLDEQHPEPPPPEPAKDQPPADEPPADEPPEPEPPSTGPEPAEDRAPADEPPADDDVPPPPDGHHGGGGDGGPGGLVVRPPGWLDRLAGKDLRPRVVLYLHLSDTALTGAGVAGTALVRPEHGGPTTCDQLADWLARTGCHVTVRPVQVPAQVEPVDGYEIPHVIRRAVRLREIGETWPHGTSTSPGLDLDHTPAYRPGGPPGQTGLHTLGPLTRAPHRARTHSTWNVRQPQPGVYVWRSPHGWIHLVTNHGTLDLGNNSYAHAIWRAAAPRD